jgi:LysM repeat protein
MKIFKLFILFFLFFCANSFSQKVIKHQVKSGESIYFIAKKYKVTESEIYDLNPKLKGGVLALKTEVKIPNKKYKQEDKKPKTEEKKPETENKQVVIVEKNTSGNTHIVAPKETLYSISKKYGVSMETICELNPELKTGTLKLGSKLKLPENDKEIVTEKPVTNKEEIREVIKETKAEELEENVALIHKVQPKESLYKISRIYNVSVKDLQELNPKMGTELPIGYELIVKKGKKPEENVVLVPNINTQNEVVEVKPLSMENMSKAAF